MYDPRNLLRQTPEAIKTLILAVLTALVVTGTIVISGEAAAAWGLVIERLLAAFYVEPVKKANTERDFAALQVAVDDEAAKMSQSTPAPVAPARRARKPRGA